ncbi:MAG: hypothetical protein KJN93_08680 [Alphaproteobacteria bacterium]|nr:hypothetical protein [Alphaproteobacteria bacterium]NNF24275.1 hypothetical protein [Paracoccaceae bacterium]
MAFSENSYSRFIAVMKVFLPLLALAILSTLFLLARAPDPNGTLPFLANDGSEFTGEQRLSEPSFVGMTSGGASLAFRADVVRPVKGDTAILQADNLRGVIESPGGGRVDVQSLSGAINIDQQIAMLEGDVRIETSTGYTIRTDGFSASLGDIYAETSGDIRAETPAGELAAGKMVLRVNDDGRHVLVFQDGVKLVYRPTEQR